MEVAKELKKILFKLSTFILAGCAIFWLFQSAFYLYSHPYLGIQWTERDGQIYYVDSSLSNQFALGDKIVMINDFSFKKTRIYPDAIYLNKLGEKRTNIHVFIERSSTEIEVPLTQLNGKSLIMNFMPIIASAIFCCCGLGIFFFSSGKKSQMLFLVCLVASIMLSSFSIRLLSSFWAELASLLFIPVSSFLTPLILHFHLYFPVKITSRKWDGAVKVAYIAAFLIAFFSFFVVGYQTYKYFQNDLEDPLLTKLTVLQLYIYILHFFVWLLLALILLIQLYRRNKKIIDYGQKKQVALILLGATAGILPSICFSALPELLIGRPLFPYEVTYSFLAIIPIIYLFAIHKYNLMGLEKQITRNATWFLLVNILGSFYLLLKVYVATTSLTVDLFMIALVLIIFYPLRYWLQRHIERMLYGGYTPREMLQQVFQTMVYSAEYTPKKLAQMISQIAYDVMQSTSALILLPDPYASLCEVSTNTSISSSIKLKRGSPILSYFERLDRIEPKDNDVIFPAISKGDLNPQEQALLSVDQYKLFVPLHDAHNILGMIVLGQKRGGGIFDTTDLVTLNIISQLSSLILQVINTNEQIIHLNEELLRREGDVRREIASDLHNRVLSRVALMIGEIDSLRDIHQNDLETKIDQLKSSVSSIDDIARKLIEKNYPPELILGLKSAIIKLKQHFIVAYPELKIKVKFDGDDDMGLTEEFALNLYRIVEGALHNIVEHASASTVLINLVINESALTLEIIDDGKGFDTTGQAKLGHFGLRIMETMARSIGGNCTIFSTLGLGTKIVVHVPMATPAHLLG